MTELRVRPVGKKPKPVVTVVSVVHVNVRTILTKPLIKAVCKLLAKGQTMDAICDYLSIQSSTFWEWNRKGELYLMGDGEPVGYAIFARFVLKARKATAIYRMRLIRRLHHGDQWRRELEILTRRDRRTFGRIETLGGSLDDYSADERFL